MAKLFVWMVLFLSVSVSGNSSAATPVKDCNVGANPWYPGRQVDVTKEIEYRIVNPLEVNSLSKGDKASGPCRLLPEVSTVLIPIGFDPSVDHPGLSVKELPWIKRCGNPIVSKFSIKAKAVEAEVVPVLMTALVMESPKKDFYDTAVYPVSKDTYKTKPSLLLQEEPAPTQGRWVTESSCGFWCKTAWFVGGALVVGAILERSNNSSSFSAPPGPTNPAP